MHSAEAREAIRSWMFDSALPIWAVHGLDGDNGGYVEQLTKEGRDAEVGYKRTRVAARQVYVFSHAAILGWSAGNELAAPGIDYLINRVWQGADKGFARQLSQTGDVEDPTPDLYDHAFVLFGFAWRHKATKDALSREWMHRTLDFVETHMRHPSGEGFWNTLPPEGWRQQNPHMHLTEACLAAYEATGEERFAVTARQLIALFRTRLFNASTATLGEYFTDDWSPAPGEDGQIVEPGHQMEWAWILNAARKQLGIETAAEIRALISFAETHGVDPASHVTYNSVTRAGAPLDRGSRTWPNTERMKAAVALWELDGVDPWPVIGSSCQLLMQQFLTREPAGLWNDAFDAEGHDLSRSVPASTLYHIFLAFAEVLRISE